MDVYVIVADGEIDQIVEGNDLMQRHARDLIDMGCHVDVFCMNDHDEASQFEDLWRARHMSFA